MFFQGISRPRNDMLMRIFMNMELTEHTGHGIPVIVSKYGRGVFHIGDTYINVVIPFDMAVSKEKRQNVSINVRINRTQGRILQCILEKPDITSKTLAERLELSPRTIARALQYLQQTNIIQRTGSRKNGSWLVVKGE